MTKISALLHKGRASLSSRISSSSATAPVITSLSPDSVVHTRLLLVSGQVGDKHTDGLVHITPHEQHLPDQQVSVVKGHFKALIPLTPGVNQIYLSHASEESLYTVTYTPLLDNPPLKLVIIAGKDSPLLYDDVPDAREPNTLETAVKKLRLAGYLWAAYTANESDEAGLGHRTFRLDETNQQETIMRSANKDLSTAHIRVLRSHYTVSEIRNPDRAQQNKEAGAAGSLFDIALQTLAQNPDTNGPKEHVAALFLDAHYDPERQLILGHAALGGGTAQVSLAIFGSHTLFAWPSCLDDLERCFTDQRQVDTRYCGIDAEGSRYYAACNVGLGAMMHEVGHLFGCPHQASGVMLRDYPRLHRSLTALEPAGAVRAVGQGVCHWHILDLLRFAGHSAFRLPKDDRLEGQLTAMPCPDGLYIQSSDGLRVIEIYGDGEFPVDHIVFPHSLDNQKQPTQQLVLTVADCRAKLPRHYTGKVKINIISRCNASVVMDDLAGALAPEQIEGLGAVYKSSTLGYYDGRDLRVLFTETLTQLDVFAGACLDGIEAVSTGSRAAVQLFGNRGGARHPRRLQPGEHLLGFQVRSGAWIDALGIITNLQVDPVCGNAQGGSLHVLKAPPSMRCCGVFGKVDDWVTQFGMLYTAM